MSNHASRLLSYLERFGGFIVRTVRSPKFYFFCLGLLTLQAAVLAITMNYPGVYDERYHVGIIQYYTETRTPFITNQAEGTGILGDLIGFTSFLYHYVLSFVYSGLTTVGVGFEHSVVVLRLFNILIMIAAIESMRRWLTSVGFKRSVIHSTIFFITTFPFFVLLSSSINYESLFLLFAFLHLLYFTKLVKGTENTKNQLQYYFIFGLLGSITKYSFLPLFLFTGIFLLGMLIFHKRFKKTMVDFFTRKSSMLLSALTIVLLLVVGGKYLMNTVQFGSPAPECSVVHSKEFCRGWAPWRRNEILDANYQDQPTSLKGVTKYYVNTWMPTMLRNVGLVGGRDRDEGFMLATPTQVVINLFSQAWGVIVVMFVLGLLLLSRNKGKTVLILSVILGLYAAFLFVLNYLQYLKLGEPIAIQTRYLLMLIPLLFAVSFTAMGYVMKKVLSVRITKQVLPIGGVVIGLIMSQYAGILGVVQNSQPGWFRDNVAIQKSLQVVKKITDKVTIKD